jgi:hypothetical protein
VLAAVSSCKLIVRLCEFRLHGFHSTVPIPFVMECKCRYPQKHGGSLDVETADLYLGGRRFNSRPRAG